MKINLVKISISKRLFFKRQSLLLHNISKCNVICSYIHIKV